MMENTDGLWVVAIEKSIVMSCGAALGGVKLAKVVGPAGVWSTPFESNVMVSGTGGLA